MFPPPATLQTLNPYFLAQQILDHGTWIANQTTAQVLDRSFPTSPHMDFFLRNVLEMTNGLNAASKQGRLDFLAYVAQNVNVMYALLIIIPAVAFLVGLILLRPTIASITQREIQIVSLAMLIPRKYVNERIEVLEVEIENIMEEMAEVEQMRGISQQGPSTANTIPAAHVMRGYSRRLMTKMYCLGLFLTGATGALMFVPPLIQSTAATNFINLIDQVSQLLSLLYDDYRADSFIASLNNDTNFLLTPNSYRTATTTPWQWRHSPSRSPLTIPPCGSRMNR